MRKANKLQSNDPSVGIVYNNIGAVWQNLEQMDSAEYYFNFAIPLRQKAQDEFGVIASQRNLAVIYEFKKQWRAAQAGVNQSRTGHNRGYNGRPFSPSIVLIVLRD